MSRRFLDMPLEEAMRTQLAVRRLRPDPVEDSLVLHLLDLAIRAPSGTNAQKWEFVVVRERRLKEGIGALNWQAGRILIFLARFVRLDESRRRMLAAFEEQARRFAETPVVVVCCYRGWPPPWPLSVQASWYGSIFPAVQNLLLAARAAGLGAALVTLPLWNLWKVRRLLGLPWNVTPCALVPMGWPRGRYRPNRRQPVEDKVHWDHWGNRRTG